MYNLDVIKNLFIFLKYTSIVQKKSNTDQKNTNIHMNALSLANHDAQL